MGTKIKGGATLTTGLREAFGDDELKNCLDLTEQVAAISSDGMPLHRCLERLKRLRDEEIEDRKDLPLVLLGMPSYSRRIDWGSGQAYWETHSRPGCGFRVKQMWARSGCTHNNLLAMALNLRKKGATHLAILHDDIEPAYWWLETLWECQKATGAQIVCATVALKDARGHTSIGVVQDGMPNDILVVRRLTLTEANALAKDFYTADDLPGGQGKALGLNTGLMLIDLTWEHADKLDLACKMELAWVKNPETGDTEAVSRLESEDWLVSRQLHRLGGKGAAVSPKRLPVLHHGDWAFGNSAWGEEGTDQEFLDIMHELKELKAKGEAA